ncbi:MAG: glycosyltransferase family 2 protein [Oscillospiraceae bacterium]|nr:glycosyltransferase family 2 protein [Oscillospiraceae bacterium]
MSALTVLQHINQIIGILFLICYSYQLLYVPVALWRRHKVVRPAPLRRYAVLISARNEEAVIAQLIDSIHQQDYPSENLDVYVVADNCTDNTAGAAREAGATVYRRSDKVHVGKGYALHFLLSQIREERGDEYYDGYFVFDADNLLSADYVSRMNEVFGEDCQIVTSYRNSKNYGDNWISAGYGLWFLRDAAFLNDPRTRLGLNAMVSGTGYLFSREIMLRHNGWPFHSLSEDTEFTVDCLLKGEKIGYCGEAELFDEQPTRLGQSVRQRMRWVRGNMLVLLRQGGHLVSGVGGENGLSCLDLLLSMAPAIVLAVCGTAAGLLATVLELFAGGRVLPMLGAAAMSFIVPYLLLFLAGAITTATQWRHIHTSAWKKILYTLTFPLFMATYVPITVLALFGKVEWKPIEHRAAISVQELK